MRAQSITSAVSSAGQRSVTTVVGRRRDAGASEPSREAIPASPFQPRAGARFSQARPTAACV